MTQLNKYIHIVCPAEPKASSEDDMADTYFQLQLFHQAGFTVILHFFSDDNDEDLSQLENLAETVYSYERNHGHKGLSIRHPYCISSRSNPALLQNLLKHRCPVLFQGMTATFYLPELAEQGYKTFIRINGIKSELYDTLMKCEKSLFRKAYSFNEARLIRKWEEKIAQQATVLVSTFYDKEKFVELYKGACVKFVPPLLPAPEVNALQGTGMYCLYFGDMSNPENAKMAHWLSDIFSKLTVPLIVADTCSTEQEEYPYHPGSNICTVSNPEETALKELIQKAQLILLPRCHSSGFDKRLLVALESGRHCICNELMVKDSVLQKLVIVANDCNEIARVIHQYFSRPFTQYDINERVHLLSTGYCIKNPIHELLEIVDQ